MCRYWESAVDLGSQVSRSLVKLIKDKPRPGWVKAIYLPSEDTTKEILELRKQVEQLQIELEKSKTKAPEGTENLSQGKDEVKIEFSFTGAGNDWRIKTISYSHSVQCTWDEIFSEISPLMLDEASENAIKQKINELIKRKTITKITKQLKEEEQYPKDFKINDNDFHTIKIQLRALSLMTESIRKRSIHDKGTYWTLTPYGDTVMTRLRAIRK